MGTDRLNSFTTPTNMIDHGHIRLGVGIAQRVWWLRIKTHSELE